MSMGNDECRKVFGLNPGWSGRWRFIFALACLFGLTARELRADDSATRFESANKFYEEGRYAAAADAYDKLLATGNISEALYFNRGNALFKMGQIGRAIASYRQALQLSPRDPELRANLQFARTRARGGSTYRNDRWRSWLSSLSLNEWTGLTSVALWLVFILLALAQWRPELKPRLRNYLVAASLAAVSLGACLGISINRELFTPSAIVIAGEAEVRNGPLDESQSIFKVRDGMELEVLDKKDGWLRVVDSAQRAGWLHQNQVIIFEPGAKQKSSS